MRLSTDVAWLAALVFLVAMAAFFTQENPREVQTAGTIRIDWEQPFRVNGMAIGDPGYDVVKHLGGKFRREHWSGGCEGPEGGATLLHFQHNESLISIGLIQGVYPSDFSCSSVLHVQC